VAQVSGIGLIFVVVVVVVVVGGRVSVDLGWYKLDEAPQVLASVINSVSVKPY